MKKMLLSFLLFPLLAAAQFKAGTWYLQASASLLTSGSFRIDSSGNSNDIQTSVPYFKFGAGRFIHPHHALQVFALGTYRSQDIVNNTNNHSFGMGVGHSFIHPINEHWGFLMNTELNARFGKSYASDLDRQKSMYNQKYQVWSVNVSPGLYVLLKQKIWLQAYIDMVNVQYTQVQNNPNLPYEARQEASKRLRITGLIPGPFVLNNIQLRLSYLLN